MGTAQSYGVLAGSTVTNTGATTITGDLGLHPGSAITGAPVVTGATNTNLPLGSPAAALQAKNDLVTAYNFLAGEACLPVNSFAVPTELGGTTKFAAVYCVPTSFQITNTLTLDAQGDPSKIWVFQMGSTLNAAVNSSVSLINGAQACNVFWQVGSSATIGVGSTFVGNILALTNITLNGGATVAGRALAQNAAVNMNNNTVEATTCATAVPPTILKKFTPNTMETGGTSTLLITLSNPNSTAVTGASLSDTLPGVLTFSNVPSTTCAGTFGSTSNSVTLTGATIPAGGFCTITGEVTPPAGSYPNCTSTLVTTVPLSTVPAACATLTVTPPGALASLVVHKTTNVGNGTFIFTSDLGNFSITTTGGSGTFTFNNVTPGSHTVTETAQTGWTQSSTTCSPVTVVAGIVNDCTVANTRTPAAVTFAKIFSPDTIFVGGASTLSITVTNPNPYTRSVNFTDTLPGPVGVAAGTRTNGCGGTLTATTGTSSVAVSGGSLGAGASCTVTVPVTSNTVGNHTNTLGNAIAILHVIPIPAPNTPNLVLRKTADRTTYTAVGQVITYTYTLTNTGNVTLNGPFTVTDDKLGTFACGSATTLAPTASVSCTKTYTVQASDLCTGTSSFQQGVRANINTGPWLQFIKSTQDTQISGAAAGGVPDGTYPCWCIQAHVPLDLHNQWASLYSTLGTGLPADVANLAWKKVNYVLNHKGSGSGLQFLKDVQTAIWKLVGEPGDPGFGISAYAQQLLNAANANPNFVPGPNEISATLVYSDGMRIFNGSIQESICEMKPPKCNKSIVNHATASGRFGTTTVTSASVSVTVTAG